MNDFNYFSFPLKSKLYRLSRKLCHICLFFTSLDRARAPSVQFLLRNGSKSNQANPLRKCAQNTFGTQPIYCLLWKYLEEGRKLDQT